MTSLSQLKKEVDLELKELHDVEHHVELIKKKLIEREIEHFSVRDLLNSFFGSLIVGLTFMFKGLLIDIGTTLPWKNVVMIVISTLIILCLEVYFIGYSRVRDKHTRKLGQFVLKRVTATYVISLSVSFFLLYLFGMLRYLGTAEHFVKLSFIISMPCAIGAAIINLLQRYVE